MRSVPSGELVSTVALGHEVHDIGREFHRVVRVDEVPGIRIDLQDRPIAGIRHARHERRDDVAPEVLQPVEGGAGMNGSLSPKARKIGALIWVSRS